MTTATATRSRRSSIMPLVTEDPGKLVIRPIAPEMAGLGLSVEQIERLANATDPASNIGTLSPEQMALIEEMNQASQTAEKPSPAADKTPAEQAADVLALTKARQAGEKAAAKIAKDAQTAADKETKRLAREAAKAERDARPAATTVRIVTAYDGATVASAKDFTVTIGGESDKTAAQTAVDKLTASFLTNDWKGMLDAIKANVKAGQTLMIAAILPEGATRAKTATASLNRAYQVACQLYVATGKNKPASLVIVNIPASRSKDKATNVTTVTYGGTRLFVR